MSRWLGKLNRLLPFGRNKPVGYDLQGNRYYEDPSLISERPRRTIEYKIAREPNEYTVGERMPVQWAAWLSHTRSAPPTIEELEKDVARRSRLAQNVALIEARDAEEMEQRRLRMLAAPAEEGEVGEGTGLLEQVQSGYPVHSSGSGGQTGSVGPAEADARDPNAPISPTLRMLSQQRTEEDRQRLAREQRGSGDAVFGKLREDGDGPAGNITSMGYGGKPTGLFDVFIPLPKGRASEAGRAAFQQQASSGRTGNIPSGSGFSQPGQLPPQDASSGPETSGVKPRARGSGTARSDRTGFEGPLYASRKSSVSTPPGTGSAARKEIYASMPTAATTSSTTDLGPLYASRTRAPASEAVEAKAFDQGKVVVKPTDEGSDTWKATREGRAKGL